MMFCDVTTRGPFACSLAMGLPVGPENAGLRYIGLLQPAAAFLPKQPAVEPAATPRFIVDRAAGRPFQTVVATTTRAISTP